MHDQSADAALPADPPRAQPEQPEQPAPPPPEPRQRWRLIVGRAADAPSQTQRDLTEAWEAAIASAALPLARTGDVRSRPRISFGAPLPVGVPANGELIDLVLTERWPAWRIRDALVPRLPMGWRLEDLHDVWLAGPALPGRVVAADYQVVLAGAGAADAGRLARVCATMLAARRVPRERRKGETTVAYDLRPLVLDAVVADPGPPPVVHMRTRFHPELGTGRPEEVVGALSDLMGEALEIVSVVRDRVVLADDLGGGGDRP
ncbi:MAG: DUF2344 domain-containing protein [Candidatus Limnocylindrales bacterium]